MKFDVVYDDSEPKTIHHIEVGRHTVYAMDGTSAVLDHRSYDDPVPESVREAVENLPFVQAVEGLQ